ncbi:MAG: FHA domain-containing protein [Planctomycetota bacterium]|jgi:pSer/pThr/pTyr-binding forkhead associated (FHA) protein
MLELHVCTRRGALLKSFALGDSEEVIIGRDSSCDVRIDAQSISREHCAVERDETGMFLRDLGSTAGTMLDGETIDRVPIASGLEVTIGPAILRFIDGEF